MKITKKILERIIKEEIEKIKREEKRIKGALERKLMTAGELADAAKSKKVIFTKKPGKKKELGIRSKRALYAGNGGWPWEEKAFTNAASVWDNWPKAVNDVYLPNRAVGMDNKSFVYYAVDEVEGRLYVVNYDVKCVGGGCS